MIRLAMSLMILGWAALMTSQLANVEVLHDASLELGSFDLMPSWVPSQFSVLTASQIAIVIFGLLIALFSLGHVHFRGTSIWTRIGRRTAPVVFAAYALGVIALLVF
jgi:hypothetical protein